MASNPVLDDFLRGEIAVGTFPSAVYILGDSKRVRWQGAHGYSVAVPVRITASTETIYDAASLTKPLITTALALRLLSEKKISLDAPLANHLSELRGTDKEAITFEQLLTHSSGLEAWWPLYASGREEESYLRAIIGRPLAYESGSRVVYSDLGFMLLHIALQRIAGRPAREIARDQIFQPLGLQAATFDPPATARGSIAATEWGQRVEAKMGQERGIVFTGFRQYLMWGEVNDGNAWGMGGYAGNAGLFATAVEVYAIARSWTDGSEKLLPNELVERAIRNHTAGREENRGLGWQLRGSTETAISAPLGPRAFGHTGFTGTSVWIDPDRHLIAVLLTNRIHPTASSVGMQNARRKFHQIAVEEWGDSGQRTANSE
jgi:serine-type D-Ala-D-Ala carboxypeptidase